jgi:hypothetical protein
LRLTPHPASAFCNKPHENRISAGNCMDVSSANISDMIFRRSANTDIGDFSLDRQALNVYMLLNGQDKLQKLADTIGNNLGTMRFVISKLLKLGLIEEVRNEVVFLDGDFFRFLLTELSLATGPIASVLIEDEVQGLGYEVDRFPANRAEELVHALAAEIMRKDRKTLFIRNMVGKIRQKGYAV